MFMRSSKVVIADLTVEDARNEGEEEGEDDKMNRRKRVEVNERGSCGRSRACPVTVTGDAVTHSGVNLKEIMGSIP